MNSLLVTLFLNKWIAFICLHTVKWFQVLLFNISNSIYQVFWCNMNNLHTAEWFQITKNNDNPFIGQMSTVFTDGLGDQGSIQGRVIPKTQRMVLDTTLLNTQHYKVRIKGKVEQSREWSSALSYTLVWYLLKREPSGYPQLKLPTFTL